jgi:putative intracellular protease/amidase
MIEKHAVTCNPYIETERENGASANPAQPVAAESRWESPVIFDGMAENSDVQQSRYMREF